MGQKLLLSLLLSLLILSVMPNLPNAYNAVTKNSFHPLVDVPAKGNLTLANKFQPNGVTLPLGRNEPAPMGIADYGIGPNGPYIIRTNEFLGHIYLKRLLAYSSQANSYCVGFQLNVVLSYQYNGNTYSLWLQDVASYNTINHNIIFVDNIWNFTSYNANVTCLKGNGHIYSWDSTTYYAYVAYNYPGSPTTLSLPATICLLINVSTNFAGQPVIQFWYDDGYGWINYDTVVVTNVYDASNVYILVDGSDLLPALKGEGSPRS